MNTKNLYDLFDIYFMLVGLGICILSILCQSYLGMGSLVLDGVPTPMTVILFVGAFLLHAGITNRKIRKLKNRLEEMGGVDILQAQQH